MDQLSRVELLECLEHLVDDVFLVDVLQNVCADDGVEVGLHLVEHTVDVLVVLRTNYI